jgi:prolyl-tRNA editing enzyme YbaK/EbsC (Cys-tRNA(Pro) deacylase)
MDRTPTRLTAKDRVRAALAAQGLGSAPVREFPEGTATAVDAANALSVPVGEIVKSLVFMAGDQAIIVLTSGPNRVDVNKVARLTGEKIARANADQVRQATGFAIGGVPPFGFPESLRTYCDPDLLQYDQVWAAAGTPTSVFAIAPKDLVRLTSAQIADVVVR